MTQAVNGLTPPCSIEQSLNVCDGDTLQRLKGLSGLATLFAHGAKVLGGGPSFADALAQFDEDLADCIEQIEKHEESLERLARRERRRRATQVEAIIDAYWTGLGAHEDRKSIKDNPWSRKRHPDLHVAWILGWRQSEQQQAF